MKPRTKYLSGLALSCMVAGLLTLAALATRPEIGRALVVIALAAAAVCYLIARETRANAAHAQRVLREQSERLRVALKASGTGTWGWDLSNDRLWWDDRLHEICGLAPGTFSGRFEDVLALVHPDDRRELHETVQCGLLREGEYALECRLVRPDGELRHVAVRALVHRDAGATGHIIGACTDVTQIRRAEAVLTQVNADLEARVASRTAELEQRTRELERANSELQRANEQLESFSYSVSHDLRAPLRAISGFAEIIARRHRQELTPKALHFFDNIVESAAHMSRLIDDLLTYSRMGRRALVLRPVLLSAVITDCVRSFEQRISESGAVVTVPSDLPVVRGDHTLLAQTFTNLLENALTYVAHDTRPVISVSCREDRHTFVVSVSDNGIGIAGEHHEKIFGVFQRLHTAETYPGTGVGLAVVKRALDLQEGAIWVESALGRGSTFYVQLPKPLAVSAIGSPQLTLSPPGGA